MTRPMLILAVGLAGYGVISTLAALGVAVAWRRWRDGARGLHPTRLAARLALLRMMPTVAGGVLASGLAAVFAAYEPVRADEPVGPLLIALALFGVLLIVASLSVALRTAVVTYLVERAWMRSATRLDVDPPAGVPAYVIDTLAPIVALVGVFSPRLVAARTVIDACSPEELAAIVAHERGHLVARDNLKRWLIACAPDVLRWTPLHRTIEDDWRNAAEDAADDLVTHGRDDARVHLAALLVKIARLAAGMPAPATVSAFADPDGLERRVRRLLSSEAQPPGPSSRRHIRLAVAVVVGVLMVAVSRNFDHLYEFVEFTVAFGR